MKRIDRNKLSVAIVFAIGFVSVQQASAQSQTDAKASATEDKAQTAAVETDQQKAAAKKAAVPDVLDSVTVTATKFETVLMETPIAVSAFTQDALDKQGIQDIRDIGDLVPNMQVGFSPSDSGVQVAIRGMTSNNFTELGDPTVGVHIDGSYTPRPQSGMALMHDVERVEILRGPQGTLFGRNSTAGAINIISARPDYEQIYGNFEVELGNYSHTLARGVFNYSTSDKIAFRGSFMIDKTDSYIDQSMDQFDLNWDTDNDGVFNGPNDVPADGIPNTDQRRNREVDASDAYGNSNRWAGRFSMFMKPTESIDWLVTYDRYRDTSAGGLSLKDCEKAAGTFFECDQPQFSASINVPGELDMTIDSWRSELQWQINDKVLLEHRLAYTSEDRYQAYDGDGGAFADPDHPAYGINRICCGGGFGLLIRDKQAIIDAGFEPYALFPFEDLQLTTRYSEYNSLTTELQLKSSGDGPLRWVVGAFYLKEENNIRFDVELPFCCSAGIPLAQSFVQPDREVESKALFGQIDYKATDKLNFTFGYRYTWDEKSDTGGSNHETIGYWVNPGQYDPANSFWYESWGLIGIVPNWSTSGGWVQGNVLNDTMGSLAEDFVDRVPGTDNTYEASWSKGTWRVGADYELNENWFLYGYVATGYKAGGFGDKVNVCNCEGGLTTFPYDPEENTTLELGFKARLADGKLNLLGNVFFTRYDDMQRTTWAIVGESQGDPENGGGRDIGTLLTTNIAEAEVKGIEIEFDWLPWQGGRIYGWFAYLDATITEFPGAEDGWFCFERAYLGLSECAPEDPDQVRPDNSLRRPTDFTGNKLPWSPEFSSTITFEHTFRIGTDLLLVPNFQWHWQSEMFFFDNNFDEGPFHSGQEAFSTFNASIRLTNTMLAWSTELYVYNLTDELVRNWADPGPGYMKGSFYSPRTYGIKLRKDF